MTHFTISTVAPRIRRVTFSNPPVNLVGADDAVELSGILDELSADPDITVVVFDSSTAGYFYNHADLSQLEALLAFTAADGTPGWVDLTQRIASAPFITIAEIRGRTRGGGDELALAFDLRYASRELATFSQLEVGTGLIPGGGGSDRLTRLVGRDHAIEAIMTGDDYDADRAERIGWVTRTFSDGELSRAVAVVAHRIASFDKAAIVAAKAQIDRASLPPKAELVASWDEFTRTVTWPGFAARIAGFGQLIEEFGLERVEDDLGAHLAPPLP